MKLKKTKAAKRTRGAINRGESSVRDFFQRNSAVFSIALAVLGVGLSVILGVLLVNVVRLQNEAVKVITPGGELPGPNYNISERSKHQIETIFREQPAVIASFVIRYKFDKHENPIVHHWVRPQYRAQIDPVVQRLADLQASDQGKSSDEYLEEAKKDPVRAERQLRNSEEARQGLIKCGPLEADALAQNPELAKIATGICYATIPPFDENTHLAVIALINVPPNETTKQVQDLRRALLTLQIDIFNRDFQGRETWPNP